MQEMKEKEGWADLVNKMSQQGAEVAGGGFFCLFVLTSAFPKYRIVSCLPPVPNRPLESRKTRLVIAWVNSSLMTAAQVKAA